MKEAVLNRLVTCALAVASITSASLAQRGHYLAALNDGRIVSGDKLTGWHEIGDVVRLDGKVISAPGKPLLWIRNTALKPWSAASPSWPVGQRDAYVEFFDGDRIVGAVVGGRGERSGRDGYIPAHLLIDANMAKRHIRLNAEVAKRVKRYVRILPDTVKRVVFRKGRGHKYRPGSLIYRAGRREDFTDIRWGSDSVRLLTKSGAVTAKFEDIAEVHMPRIDLWRAHYRDLAVLSPDLRTRLVRIETTGGLIATASLARMAATPFVSERTRQSAARNLEGHGRTVESLAARDVKSRQTMEKTRTAYDKTVAGYKSTIKDNQDACVKLRSQRTQHMEKQERENAAEFARQRKTLTEAYDNDIKEIEKRLSGMPADKRDARRKTDVKARTTKYKSDLRKIETRERKAEADRLDDIDKLDTQLASRGKAIERAGEKLAAETEKFDQTVERRRQEIDILEMRKIAYANLPRADGSAETWDHMIQPAWSLDPLWVDFKTIRMRSSLAPTEFPLSRLDPDKAITPAFQPWSRDRSAWGGPLHSGGRMYAWGFGVHAYSELTFAIPPEVSAFRSIVGIDSIANTGGCVQARVYIGSIDSKPLYQSPLLIGSGKTGDTGVVRISPLPKTGGRLILQADPAVRSCPDQADPLNICDKFDWLEPKLIFDKARLWDPVRKHIGPRERVWRDWTLEIDKPDAYSWGSFPDPVTGDAPMRLLPVVAVRGRAMKLSRKMTIRGGDKWLVVDAGYVDGSRQDPKSIILRIDDEEVAPEKIPLRQYWRRAAPLVFSVEKYKRKEANVVLTQRPDGKAMYWRRIAVTNREPDAYRLLMALKDMGVKDMQVSRGIGLEMQRHARRNERVDAAIKLERKGAVANYYDHLHSYYHGWPVARSLMGFTIGPNWTGGDKDFTELQKFPGLRYVVVTNDSGVSKKAVDELSRIKRGPDQRGFRIHRPERMPSARFGIRCGLTIRNRRHKEVAVVKVDWSGRLIDFRRIKPGSEMKIVTEEGCRYEAHPPKLYYRKSSPIAKCAVKGQTVWEIK
ncbi:MAG: NPCBM/NEW2 domain-containing protein [Phycisphaerae bacterium]|nr:NPCBM/NEW2 domain-containing protein [Phycisphaerae bacterium]